MRKRLSIISVLFVFATEYLHWLLDKLFDIGKIIHSYYFPNGIKTPIYWKSQVYHFVNESFTLYLVSLLLFFCKGKELKATMTSIFVWYLIEWIEMFIFLAFKNNARLYINDGSWIQLSACLTVGLRVYFGSKN